MTPLNLFVYADRESKLRRCLARADEKETLSEREILKKVAEMAGPEFGRYARLLYSNIMDLSRSYQSALGDRKSPLAEKIAKAIAETEGKRLPDHALVACQGTEGAYSQQACEKLFA